MKTSGCHYDEKSSYRKLLKFYREKETSDTRVLCFAYFILRRSMTWHVWKRLEMGDWASDIVRLDAHNLRIQESAKTWLRRNTLWRIFG